MLHLDGAGPDTPRLPERRAGAWRPAVASMLAHAAGVLTLALVLGHQMTAELSRTPSIEDQPCIDVSHVVFVATDPRPPGAGGGGGGNRHAGPIRRAQGVGRDAITFRTAKPRALPVNPAPALPNDIVVPSIAVDAVPMASGTFEQVGLPSASVLVSPSTGPGSGGGVGTGTGTGLGAGRGPGLGPGSGGGTGGGAYRPGGAVTAPRLILEVKPKYTSSALARRLQGTVELELIVTSEGFATQIHVVRSLDPGGLDDEAVAAVKQWRFAPGRAAGVPVDVLVTAILDFTIR